ncbi:hypothetical protein EV401DRAFT_2000287, partial [Pisolithus croceorrhizus]
CASACNLTAVWPATLGVELGCTSVLACLSINRYFLSLVLLRLPCTGGSTSCERSSESCGSSRRRPNTKRKPVRELFGTLLFL